MKLQVFNSLTRQKEEFVPLRGKKIGLYTCGPTVYNFPHIGNLRTYIFEDILKRALKKNGFMVKHVMNVTDVGHLVSDADEGEDKMESSAMAQQKTAGQIANFYLKIFKADIRKLNIKSPNTWCRATDHIREQINFIKGLEEKGFTYRTSDGIYFDSSKITDYGKLANLDLTGLKAGARVEASIKKKNQTDFALWKFSPANKKRQQEWKSPWGIGFPGWHIECSAMSQKYLGETFDIHCGAIDLKPIHHTNEIAQSEALNDAPPARYWIHGEFLDLGDTKMSKSKGGFITLDDLIKKKYNPLAFRYLTFATHYRTKMNFSFEALDSAQKTIDNIYKDISTWSRPSKGSAEYEDKFFSAVNDDLNMPKAIAIMHDMINDPKLGTARKKRSILKFDSILGLDFAKVRKQAIKIPRHIQKLAHDRQTLRVAGQYDQADIIRQQMEKIGYSVNDTAEGPTISRI
ncbi:MAG: cysteine--tRNA ligase [Candidatus Portnoybacteria bacterium CG10_big_fil_rev_8_21_14_0_10_36_7]|uniref:Cysteine--tRNA ligase n=1 Tax=Candidatus Portnoybacteria bacterium CG10_big_fil_rev_8_21_14_0_10_36_7 TaxID=1974812 RepID=A0A2M8KEI7_9BACT|nr:MAG: cysteine--tRNA ligase [Candidatus Portnoybacteria bacterium CG10_big_fil_rev_8_21_14_0_10_36_7]